jgi:hypothetical protein
MSLGIFWKRLIVVDGSYILEKGENVESYFKTVGYCGDNFDTMLLNYKVRVFANKKTYIICITNNLALGT